MIVVLDRPIQLALVAEGIASIAVGHGEVRRQPDRLVVILDGPVQLTQARVRIASIVEGERVARREPNRLVEVLDRPPRVPEAPVGIAPVVERERIRRIQLDGLVVVLDRPLGLASAAIRVTSIVEGEGQLGIEADGLVVILDRAAQLALPGEDETSIVEACGVQGGQPDGLVVILDGAIQFPLAAVGAAPVVEGQHVTGLVPDGLVEVSNSPVQLPFEGVGVSAVVEGQGQLGIEPDCLVEVLDGPVGLSFLGIGRSAVVIGAGELRVELYRSVVVLDGPVSVALDTVGCCPVVVGEGQLGLGLPVRLDHCRATLDHQVGRDRCLPRADTPLLGGGTSGRRGWGGDRGQGSRKTANDRRKLGFHAPHLSRPSLTQSREEAHKAPAPCLTPMPRSLSLVTGSFEASRMRRLSIAILLLLGQLAVPAWAQWTDEAQKCAETPDPALAFELCTRAIQSGALSGAGLALSYNNRGRAHHLNEDYAQAIKDYGEAIEIDPDYPLAFYNRGLARFDQGFFIAAVPDFVRAVQIDPTKPYRVLALYLAKARGGDPDREMLATNAAQLNLSQWPGPVASLYLDQITPQAVIDAAKDPDPATQRERQCEAYFYIGEYLLI